jgi:Tfp pilus assembly protein PilZ
MNVFAHEIRFADNETGETLMRSFIRHPSDIPIECQVDQPQSCHARQLQDVSYGGLAFAARKPLEIGAEIKVRIPGIEPAFEVIGQVAWCRKKKREYVVGVQFLDQDDSYRARMVEQVCHIEHYKAEVREKEGRQLSGEQAAEEWIIKYAKDFPSL